MSAEKEKMVNIIIQPDGDEENRKKEQFKVYQRNGETVQVPIGVKSEVPLWVAELAKKVGDIVDF